MRNFWIECKIDGRKTKLTGGPRSKDGGFNLTIYQRSDGESIKVLKIIGWKELDNEELVINVYSPLNKKEFEIQTKK